MKALDEIRNYFAGYAQKPKGSKGGARNVPLEQELARLGDDVCREAYQTKARGNITGNQANAYFWALYLKRKMIAHGFAEEDLASSPALLSKEVMGADVYGRDEAEDMMQNYIPEVDEYVLLVSNAIWYSKEQEGRGEPVLSQELPRLYDAADKYGGQITFGNLGKGYGGVNTTGHVWNGAKLNTSKR